MKGLLLGILLASSLFGGMLNKKWEYLIYYNGAEYDKTQQKVVRMHVLNDGINVGVGSADNQNEARAQMLREYFKKGDNKTASFTEVLATLGAQGWELITVKSENGNDLMYFKR